MQLQTLSVQLQDDLTFYNGREKEKTEPSFNLLFTVINPIRMSK